MTEGYRMIEWFEDLSLGMRFKSETSKSWKMISSGSQPSSIRSPFHFGR